MPNGVFHYKFLTVLLTVSTVTKMRLSSGNIYRVEMGKIFKTLNLQSEARVGIELRRFTVPSLTRSVSRLTPA